METDYGRERFQLLLKHFEGKPFGASAWVKYKSFDHKRIVTKIKVEETFLENLHKTRAKRKQRKETLKIIDLNRDEFSNIEYRERES